MTAYVIGNGTSRRGINLETLDGSTYGCNALYKDFTPDVLVATDEPISRAIQNSGYALHNKFYTRHRYANTGAIELKKPYTNWSSGPNALQLAVHDKHKHIVLLGFDFGSTDAVFNNIYAGTEFYKHAHETATFSGNWQHQVESVIKHYPKVTFEFVVSPKSNRPEFVNQYKNAAYLDFREFTKLINNV